MYVHYIKHVAVRILQNNNVRRKRIVTKAFPFAISIPHLDGTNTLYNNIMCQKITNHKLPSLLTIHLGFRSTTLTPGRVCWLCNALIAWSASSEVAYFIKQQPAQ